MRLLLGSQRVRNIIRSCLKQCANHYSIDMDIPVKDLPEEQLDKILYGSETR